MKHTFITFVLFALFAITTHCITIRWTAAGGTNLWDYYRNWDCNCLPTINDDVIIDVANIPANVQIGGTPAVARSLTVGGTSQFTQQLYIQGQLTLAMGGKINNNGNVYLNSAPNLPFTSGGTFNAANNMVFASGAIAGNGMWMFTQLNLTGPALKVFAANQVVVSQQLLITNTPGATGVVNVNNGSLIIPTGASVYSDQSLTLTVADGAHFVVNGSVVFAATVPSRTLTFRGYSNVHNLTSLGGNVVVNDNSDFAMVNLAAGATLTLIGATQSTRNFGNIAGGGTVNVQGGTNNVKNLTISVVQLQSGILATNSTIHTSNLQVTGGIIEGSGTINAQSATLSNSQLNYINLVVQSLTVAGFTSFSDASVTVTVSGVVSSSSQFTMAGGSTFTVNSGVTISQSAPLKVLPSGSDQPALFTNNGQWTSSSQFTLIVNTNGNGSWSLGNGALLSITGISFNAGTLTVAGSTFLVQTGVVTIASVNGLSNGSNINFSGKTFYANVLNINTYIHNGGNTLFNTGNIGNLTIVGGVVTVQQSGHGQLLNFEAGTFSGQQNQQTPYTTNSTVLTSTQPKTLTNLKLTTNSIHFLCPQSCQLFTNNAIIETPQ